MGLIIDGMDRGGPEGIAIRNWATDAAVANLRNAPRPPGERVVEIISHETVTRSWADTVRVLQLQHLGVHLIVDEHGQVCQHADLATDMTWHASQHNGPSVGIELVNPYVPEYMPAGGPWKDVLDPCPWAAGGKYVLPLPAQAETLAQLVGWLTSPASTLPIPLAWPTFDGHAVAMGRVAACERPPVPGVIPHMAFAHADGPWLVLYLFLRLELGLCAQDAYGHASALAVRATAPGYLADVSDLLTAPPLAPLPAAGPTSEPHE